MFDQSTSIRLALVARMARAACRRLRRLALALLIDCSSAAPGATGAPAAMACRPTLSVKNVREIRLSPMPTVPWIWRATIAADTSFCATRSGSFEIDFIRIKEQTPDLQFTEKFRWQAGQFDVAIELAPDESILEFRIGFVAPCVCREVPHGE